MDEAANFRCASSAPLSMARPTLLTNACSVPAASRPTA